MADRTRVFVILAVLGVTGSVLVVGRSLTRWRSDTIARWAQVSAGDSEHRVKSLLGEAQRELARGSAPEDYYVKGYGRKVQPIHGKVLIYLEKDMILYVWISQDGRVEDVFRGVS